MSPVAVVTGGNRGLGRETCRQLAELGWTVLLTARDPARASAAAEELRAEVPGAEIVPWTLDVTDSGQAAALSAFVADHYPGVDALVNNAGAILEPPDANGPLDGDPDVVLRTFETNTVGTLRVTRALAGHVAAVGGNVVNVSSGMGGIAEMDGGWTGYRLSKAGLNALTRVLHAELQGRGVRVNSVCPGWVRTEMGGPNATRGVPEGAASIVWAATLPAGGPAGGFFRDGEPIPW